WSRRGEGGRGVRGGEGGGGGGGGVERRDGVEAHHVARGIVQHERDAVEVRGAMQHADEIAEERREIAVRGGGAGDVEQDRLEVRRCVGGGSWAGVGHAAPDLLL